MCILKKRHDLNFLMSNFAHSVNMLVKFSKNKFLPLTGFVCCPLVRSDVESTSFGRLRTLKSVRTSLHRVFTRTELDEKCKTIKFSCIAVK